MNIERLQQVATGAKQLEVPVVELDLATVELLIAAVYSLKGMSALHEDMMRTVNHRESFYDAACLEKMNTAPSIAKEVLTSFFSVIPAQAAQPCKVSFHTAANRRISELENALGQIGDMNQRKRYDPEITRIIRAALAATI